MSQAVQYLPSKLKTLSSNPAPPKETKEILKIQGSNVKFLHGVSLTETPPICRFSSLFFSA
jgi:hypothetical protein